MRLSSEMDINVVHRYSHLVKKMLSISYNALSVNLTGTFQVCDGFSKYKAKELTIKKETYTRASHPGERILWTRLVHFKRVLLLIGTGLA